MAVSSTSAEELKKLAPEESAAGLVLEPEAASAAVADQAAASTSDAFVTVPQSPYQPNQDVDYAGAFTYRYPLQLPAGTNGLQPTLALAYNSSGPNGLLGKGFWLQGLSAISRDALFPIQFSAEDRYALDGQSLFYAASGNPVGDKTFHPERENFDRIQVFLRAAATVPVSAAAANDATAYWVVSKKDGTQSFYGDYPGRNNTGTNVSTIPALGKSTPRLWALSKVQDANGNFFTYNYHYDAATGAYYPISIVYTQGGGLTSFKTVRFTYETRADHTVVYSPSKVDLDHRLTWITVLVGTDVEGNGGALLRKYGVGYSPATGQEPSQVLSLREGGTDGNAPNAGYLTPDTWTPTGTFLPETILTWQNPGPQPLTISGEFATTDMQTQTLGLFDFNGDGRNDLLQRTTVTSGFGNASWRWKVTLSTGTGFGPTTLEIPETPMAPTVCIADYDGDGRTDILVSFDDTILTIYQSTGTAFLSTTAPLNRPAWAKATSFYDFDGDGRLDLFHGPEGGIFSPSSPPTTPRWQVQLQSGPLIEYSSDLVSSISSVADVDGDGRLDLMLGNAYGRRFLAKFNGNGFLPLVEFTLDLPAGWYNLGYYDFNGDGKSDLLQQYSRTLLVDGALGQFSSWRVLFSNGNGFEPSGPATADFLDYLVRGVADVDGDGRPDLVLSTYKQATAQFKVLRLVGNAFAELTGWTSSMPVPNFNTPFYTPSSSNVLLSDLNGDGKADLYFQYDTADGVRHLEARRSVSTAAGLVSGITLSIGGSIAAAYAYAPQLPGAVSPAGSNYLTGIANTSPRPLVTTLVVDAGLGTLPMVTSYGYANALRLPGAPDKRADLGFQTMTRTTGAAQTVTTFDQSVALRGLITSVVVQDTSPTPLKYSETRQSWTAVPSPGAAGSSFQKLTQTLTLAYDGLGDASPARTKTTLTYNDTNGNLLEKLDWGLVNASGQSIDGSGSVNDQAQVKEVYAYSAILAPNYLYRTKQKTTYSWNQGHSSFAIAAKSFYYYDGQAFGALGSAVPNGRLTRVEDFIDSASFAATTWTHDAWGNVLTVRDGRTNDPSDPLFGSGDTEVRSYDTTYRSALVSVKNALWNAPAPTKHLTTVGYDTLLRPVSTTDGNGQTSTTHYDAFSRVDYTLAPTVAPNPADDAADPAARTTYVDNEFPRSILSEQKTSASEAAAYLKTYTYLDGLGRTLQTKRQGVGGWITQDWGYDASGRNTTVSIPYLSTDSANSAPSTAKGVTTFSYDVLGRVITVTNPDTTTRRTEYLKTTTRTIDENLHVTEVEDYGNVVVTTKFSGTYPSQTYNPAVNSQVTVRKYRGLTTITDNKGNVVQSTTDRLGRQTQYQDADIGTWKYTYDANSNLKTRTDNKPTPQVVSYTYDKLNRLLTKAAADTTVNATYTYDETGHGSAVGQLTSVTFNRGSDSLSYDERGRVSSRTRVLDGIAQTESSTYDSMNRVRTQTLPDGEVLTSTYGLDGNLVTLTGVKAGVTTNYLVGATYTPLGKVKTLVYGKGTTAGNGVTTTYRYYDGTTADPTTGKTLSHRLRQIQAGTGNAVMNLTYSYDAGDNLASRTDANNPTYSETYTYDAQDRLTQAVSALSGTQTYTYDSIDNILTKDGLSYTYASSRPHAVTSIGTYSYTYDSGDTGNGNLTARTGGRTIAYDAENRVTSVSDGGSYTYNSERQRTIKTEGTKTTYYFFPDFEQEYTSGTLSNTLKYYSANGQKIAQYSGTTLNYLFADHLGSSTRMTNTSGTVVRTQSYKPYGSDAAVTGTATTKYQYTGQEKDSGGLYYYNARYYDPELGRFTQPDPAVWDPQQSAQLSLEERINPYLYALNNPVKYTDPSGLEGISLQDGLNALKQMWDSWTKGAMTSPTNQSPAAQFDRKQSDATAKLASEALDNSKASGSAAFGFNKWEAGVSQDSTNGTLNVGASFKTGEFGGDPVDLVDFGNIKLSVKGSLSGPQGSLALGAKDSSVGGEAVIKAGSAEGSATLEVLGKTITLGVGLNVLAGGVGGWMGLNNSYEINEVFGYEYSLSFGETKK